MSSSSTKPLKSAKPSLPKPPTRLDPSCIISDTAILTGTHLITIGPNVILHPRAKLISNHGPITLSQGCIISEKVTLGLISHPATAASSSSSPSLSLENTEIILAEDVVLEPGCCVESSLGKGTSIEAGARIGKNCNVGEYCKVTPLCVLRDGETLDDFEILFANGQRRKERRGLEKARKIVHDKEILVLRKLVQGNLAKWQSEVG